MGSLYVVSTGSITATFGLRHVAYTEIKWTSSYNLLEAFLQTAEHQLVCVLNHYNASREGHWISTTMRYLINIQT